MTALGGPVGIAVAGLSALTVGIAAHSILTMAAADKEDKMLTKIEATTKARKEYTKTLQQNQAQRRADIENSVLQGSQAENLTSRLQSLMSVEKKSAGEKAQIKSIVQQLNDIYPELNLKYDEEKDRLNKSTAAIRKNIAAQKELAMAKAYAAQMESVAKDQVETESKLSKAIDEQAKARERLQKANDAVNDAKKTGKVDPATGQNEKLIAAMSEQAKASEAFNAADANVKKYQQSLDSLNQEFDKLGQKQISETNYATFLQNIDSICKEAKIKAKDIPARRGEWHQGRHVRKSQLPEQN